jgi:hypothetical protein
VNARLFTAFSLRQCPLLIALIKRIEPLVPLPAQQPLMSRVMSNLLARESIRKLFS